MSYYLGGYFLIKLKPFDWSPIPEVYTCSNCINDSLLQSWSFRWLNERVEETTAIQEQFGLTTANIVAIRHWVDTKRAEGKLGYYSEFADLETAQEYKQKFFSHLDGVKLLAMYFDEQAADAIRQEYESKSSNIADYGLYRVLSKKIPESENADETTIGYDLAGIEVYGGFHSFHCHGIGVELTEKFGLTLNRFGLFDYCADWKPVFDAFKNGEIGVEPVPWFVAKTKLITSS